VNEKLELLKLWALGLGIPFSVFENKRFLFAFGDNDPVDSLRAVQRAIEEHYEPEWLEANRNITSPRNQLEFITLMRD
jgi:hypothetical protein